MEWKIITTFALAKHKERNTMKKSTRQERTPIALRQKPLKDGRVSLYLDIYDYSAKDKGQSHKYEFLKLYLLPETSRENKAQNKATMQSAKTIQAQRLIDRANGKANIKTAKGEKILLQDYLMHYAEIKSKYGQSNANADLIKAMAKHLNQYKSNVTLASVDKPFCTGFIAYLLGAQGGNATKSHKALSKRTVKIYFSLLSGALSNAVKEELIESNPAEKVTREERKVFAFDENKRTYLTLDEVKKLCDTPIYREVIKQAFLFACFCGLRISDIAKLQWGDIHKDADGNVYIETDMKKTQKHLHLPIPETALQFVPDRNGEPSNARVFEIGTTRNVNTSLKKWAKDAEIDKDICFHVSRHTFATSLLTMGADIYTTSKLLGHTKIATTQIYAEIVNEKKQNAVNLLNNIKL